jgi:sec-independent protein translocase protein TatB
MGVDMIFIFLLALILFGPKRLPEIAREVGKFMAEFKRASNDFKYQLQAELDKASAPTQSQTLEQSSTAAPVVLPPAAPSPAQQTAPADAESEHERLMRTARMAFEAQNFTLRPPEPPPIAHVAPQPPAGESSAAEPVPAHPANDSAPSGNSAVQQS